MKFNSNLQYSNKKLVRASVEMGISKYNTFYPNYNNVTALQQVLTSEHDITSTTFVTKDS